MRDKHVDLMLVTGIVLVVMGHKYQPAFLYFPAYSFHMGLFFFISGYLVRPGFDSEKLPVIKKKTKSQLLEYFKYNLLFCIITYLLAVKGINLGCKADFSTLTGLKNTAFAFFITPFITGHQYHLFIPAWFLLQLYIIQVIFVFLKTGDNRKRTVQYGAVIAAALLLLYAGLKEYTDYRLLVIRTAYGLLFFYTGYMVKMNKKAADRVLLSGWFPVAGFVCADLLRAWGGNTSYSIVFGSVHNIFVFVPLLYSMIVIFITYNLSHYISSFLSGDEIITAVAMRTKEIMIWHLSVFFCVNYIMYRSGIITAEKLSDVYYGFNPERFWLLYVLPAVVIPVLAGMLPERKHDLLNILLKPVQYSRDFIFNNAAYTGPGSDGNINENEAGTDVN